MNINEILERLGLHAKNKGISTGTEWLFSSGKDCYESYSPVNGKLIGFVEAATKNDYEKVIVKAKETSLYWRKIPAPLRGALIREYGEVLRQYKDDLGALVSYEMGKSLQEGKGEVQEMIDICEFCTGLSRQLHGLTMHSERPEHRMYEQWHPLGVVGIISAFNFPIAVWAWNFTIATICGNATIWKPSEKTPLTALACFNLLSKVLKKNKIPEGLCNLIIGSVENVGIPLVDDRRVDLVSATGSTRMGKIVATRVAARLGKSLLELGGNNALIVSEHANIKLAIPALVFGAVGTCGQRCTSTRRALIHETHFKTVKNALLKAYKSLSIGSPLDEKNNVGPLIDKDAVNTMQQALKKIKQEGGEIIYGGEPLDNEGGCYVKPALVILEKIIPMMKEETFVPILYLMPYSGSVEEAIKLQNDVDQGLSSALFSNNFIETETFLSHSGSDCGIANINIGTSGAEIGGAFGGEKDTGGGRESGSDAWKAYMRRQTNTLNFGDSLPFAQGILFDL